MNTGTTTKMKETDTSKMTVKDYLWELGNIPVDKDGYLEEPFYQFDVGDDREMVWHWLEDKFDITIGDIL